MEYKFEDVRTGSINDKIIYVCDYRYNDFNDKPIRHIKPTKVLVKSNDNLPKNKNIYYSECHLVVLGKEDKPTSKILSIADNTGYRSFAGTPLRMFDNLEECQQAYKEFVKKNLDQFQDYKTNTIGRLNQIETELKDLLK